MGILRVHFTADDLARVTIANEPDPLWEVAFTRFRLRDPVRPLAFTPWLNRLRASPDRCARIRAGGRVLDPLTPTGPYFPDFLTPNESARGLDAGLEALLSTPRRRLRRELRLLGERHRLPGWVRPLAEGDMMALRRLAGTLHAYHEAAVAPFADLVGAAAAADRACQSGNLLRGGLAGLFDGMRPLMRWQPPVLEVGYGLDRDLVLGGRGLRLVPSYFCQRAPLSLADQELPPVLIYPIAQRHRWQPVIGSAPALTTLMGRNRSAVLQSLDRPATTTQLARAVRISLAAASRHASALREAGLVRSWRDGNAVLHLLTPLGHALLQGCSSA
ncbi:Helix-turn-helix domain-containing protein [Nonomuraea solani]|uniref:Helix-turn-helix domain-containing protein n=1 Tax=Nonomuraea solani TaxID=1144553 RepID=A0A1H6EYK1_9ACTN|nr:winged helix-turn-helix domain-containing protein [Nonomuraea solani]SEH02970.1 Helix-turn-helix domain-containing protein [Nonomuraea solani]